MTQDYRLISPDQVTPHPANPRRGNLPAIVESVRNHGLYGAVVVQQSTGHVIVGNHRVLAARELGLSEIPAAFLDVDDDEALRILANDNRTSDLGGYDNDALTALLAGLHGTERSLDGSGYTDDDLTGLLAPPPPLTDPDDVPSAPAVPVTRLGDVWLLGPHRLLCGDATTDLDKAIGDLTLGCVLTDPPYGINLDTDYTKMENPTSLALIGPSSKWRPMIGDDHAFDPRPVAQRFDGVAEQFWFGADYYRRLLSDDDRDGAWLVWDKRNEDSDGGFGSGFELIWSRQRHQRRLLRHYYFGTFGREAAHRLHPTQKPTGMLEDILTRWAPEHCTVADPYAGSGSTLIACHRTGRTAVLAEIDPGYCDVILQRWHNHTGVTPTNQDTGQAWLPKPDAAEMQAATHA